MSTVIEFACEFQFDMPTLDIEDWEFYDEYLVSRTHWLKNVMEFDSDIWEFFCGRDEPLQLDIGFRYHVFICGTITLEYGTDWETGREELDGLYAEFDKVLIDRVGEILENGL